MQNAQIAGVLDQIADLLEFDGQNPFRVRAYRNASRVIQDLPEPVTSILDDPARKLTEIQGIGADLADKIGTLARGGTIPLLEELTAKVPESVLALLRVQGVGPKKAAALFKELGVRTLDELRAACEAQKVRGLAGFGEKTEATILAGIAHAEKAAERLYWAEAELVAAEALAHMKACPCVRRAELAGSYRRRRETIGDLDLLVESDDADAAMHHLAKLPDVDQVLARGETKMSVRLAGALQLDMRVVGSESFGAALQYFTGSKAHNVVLRGMAKERGLKINEYGVYRVIGERETYIAGREEADVYAALDLPLFPPEIREARREFEWAAAGALPRLVELSDLLGDLHMHTDATDGSASLAEMAAAAQARSLEYIAITDHSKRATMARGLDGARLRKQWSEIDRLNAKLSGLHVLKGVEVDILEKGGLDLSDDVLAEADWVVASVHYGQNQSREQITRRIVEALANPHVSAIAHPTGRLINRRPAYEVDLDAVFRAARQHGKLLELNSNPARLDLDDVACAAAAALGVPIVISTDAHSTAGLAALRYGVMQARRAGLTKEQVANARPWSAMKQLIGRSAK